MADALHNDETITVPTTGTEVLVQMLVRVGRAAPQGTVAYFVAAGGWEHSQLSLANEIDLGDSQAVFDSPVCVHPLNLSCSS